MDVHFDGITFYEYNPEVGDELIGVASFERGSYKIKIELKTSKNEVESFNNTYLNKKYVCQYTLGRKKYRQTCYDTYMGYDEKEMEKSVLFLISDCYNKHKRGKKAWFNWI